MEDNGVLTVRAPIRMSEALIQEFVAKHADWVAKKQAERHAMIPAQPKQYQPGEHFPYLGQEYALAVVQIQHPPLILEDQFLLAESARANAALVFQNWYRQQANLLIPARVKLFADQYDLHYARVRITSARTRWGSCSSQGTLSFSWRLIMTPLEVVDYVVIHELAHTVHHNHSKRFWGLVEKILPEYKERRKRLKQYGQQVQ